jgi:methionyl-tRNA formyltransferase
VLLVHGTGILKPETFGLAPIAVNLHCGVLPTYRGHDSTFWALHEEDYERVGASLHVIDAGVDTGSLIAVAHVPCAPGDSDLEVWVSAFSVGVDVAVELIETLRDGTPLTPQPRVHAPGKHYGRKGLSDYVAFARRRRQALSSRRLAEAS